MYTYIHTYMYITFFSMWKYIFIEIYLTDNIVQI